ncbi:hypothetical protein D3C85_1840550 [compost metagenome]|jgi:hypothetical protein
MGREKIPGSRHFIDATDAMPLLLEEGFNLELKEVRARIEFPWKAPGFGLGKRSDFV